jgi:nucleotide-binding universal stress UspA family protein
MFGKILVAVDGSEHAYKALDVAVDLAEKYGASLLVSHVIVKHAIPPYFEGLAVEKTEHIFKTLGLEIAEKIFAECAARLRDRSLKSTKMAVAEGEPARAITDLAEKEAVDLIAMGTRGLSGIQDVVIGSVAHKVTILSRCPVITVK